MCWFSSILFLGMFAFSAFLYLRYDRTLKKMLLNDLEHEFTEVELLLHRAKDRAFLENFILKISAPIENENDFCLRVLDRRPSIPHQRRPAVTA